MIFEHEMKSTHCTTIVFHRIRMNPESRLFFSYFFIKVKRWRWLSFFERTFGEHFLCRNPDFVGNFQHGKILIFVVNPKNNKYELVFSYRWISFPFFSAVSYDFSFFSFLVIYRRITVREVGFSSFFFLSSQQSAENKNTF